MDSVEIGYSILVFILFFWAFLVIVAVMMALVSKSKLGDTLKRLKAKFFSFHDKRHSH